MDLDPGRRSSRRLHPDGVMDDTDHFAGIAADIDELAHRGFRKIGPAHKLGNGLQWFITIHFCHFSFTGATDKAAVRSKMLFLDRIANQSLLFLAKKRADDAKPGEFLLDHGLKSCINDQYRN